MSSNEKTDIGQVGEGYRPVTTADLQKDYVFFDIGYSYHSTSYGMDDKGEITEDSSSYILWKPAVFINTNPDKHGLDPIMLEYNSIIRREIEKLGEVQMFWEDDYDLLESYIKDSGDHLRIVLEEQSPIRQSFLARSL